MPEQNTDFIEPEDIPTRKTKNKVYRNEKQKIEEERKDYVPIINPKITIEVQSKPKPTREQIERIETPEQSEKEDRGETEKGRTIEKIHKERKKTNWGVIEKTKRTRIETLKGNSILIITEKPQAAAKIAAALSSGRERRYVESGVSYYEFSRNNENIIVACAVGHLFSLSQDVKGSDYPIFEISWKPNFEVRKNDFTRKYYSLLSKLSKRAKEIIVATDYDVEGETIGYNIIRFIAHQKDAKRMKYSSLTKDELEEAFKKSSPTIDWGQAIAGETRHFIDWYYGINLSRALMNSIKAAGKFRIMSIGRVQGPTLKLIVDKEKEIMAFKPVPYWKIFIDVIEKKDKTNKARLRHVKDIFDENQLAVFEKLKGREAEVRTDKSSQKISPPAPFDLTTLQTEAYKFFYITPSKTLEIAQKLYLAGLISYPRTSSQKIPEAINPKGILKKLSNHFKETKFVFRDKPVEGKKSDPAHPSISPTGEFDSLSGEEKKIYELIVKRFISCFCDDALIENKTITAVVDELVFKERGLEIGKKGWMEVYDTKLQEKELRDMNGLANIVKVDIEKDETKPPKRYSPASIISELEKRGLGTKCLTGDTKIILNGGERRIEEVFEASEKDIEQTNFEIRKLLFKTISLADNQEIKITQTESISKRLLKENEEIISIESPSAKIKVTGDHRVYIIEDKKIKEIFAKELRIENKLVGLLKNYKENGKLFEISELGSKFKIKEENMLHKFCGKSTKGIKISHFPIRWSISLAWVLGYYYGDGSYSNPEYNGSHQVYFTTTENKALELLKQNIKDIFGNNPYCYDLKGKYKVNCNCAMATVLIKIFPNLESKKPITIPQEFIGDFLRGFFDADGNVHLRPLCRTIIKGKGCNSSNTPRVKIVLANEVLINWISSLLEKLGIDNNIVKTHALCKGKRFDCWVIRISNKERVEKYAIKIGFDSYKEDILYKGLKCNSPHYKVLKNSALVYFKLTKQEMKPEDISFNLKISRYDVMRAIKHLFSLNLITKRRIGRGISQKWFYYIKEKDLAYERYCIKLLYNRISKDLYELPIEKIAKENYKGYVYDLSVDKESPNFITSGNILVHNSTRSSIIETLYDRGYIEDNKSIRATPIGINLIDTLGKYSPIIIDEKLTKDMEKDLDSLRLAKKDLDKKQLSILHKAQYSLRDISEDFKKKELNVGRELIKAEAELWKRQNLENELDFECPKCKKGKFIIKYSPRFKRKFIGCTNYPQCNLTFGLPPNSFLKKIDKFCEFCKFPLLMSLKKARKPWIFCFNPNCPSRQEGSAKASSEDSESGSGSEEGKSEEQQFL